MMMKKKILVLFAFSLLAGISVFVYLGVRKSRGQNLKMIAVSKRIDGINRPPSVVRGVQGIEQYLQYVTGKTNKINFKGLRIPEGTKVQIQDDSPIEGVVLARMWFEPTGVYPSTGEFYIWEGYLEPSNWKIAP